MLAVVQDDGEPSGPYIDVDVHSMAQAGTFLQSLGTSLSHDVTTVRKAATDALAAIPPSDLYSAYAFCWGRWSQVFEDAHAAVTGAGTAVKTSAGIIKKTDRNAMPPPPGPRTNGPH